MCNFSYVVNVWCANKVLGLVTNPIYKFDKFCDFHFTVNLSKTSS